MLCAPRSPDCLLRVGFLGKGRVERGRLLPLTSALWTCSGVTTGSLPCAHLGATLLSRPGFCPPLFWGRSGPSSLNPTPAQLRPCQQGPGWGDRGGGALNFLNSRGLAGLLGTMPLPSVSWQVLGCCRSLGVTGGRSGGWSFLQLLQHRCLFLETEWRSRAFSTFPNSARQRGWRVGECGTRDERWGWGSSGYSRGSRSVQTGMGSRAPGSGNGSSAASGG